MKTPKKRMSAFEVRVLAGESAMLKGRVKTYQDKASRLQMELDAAKVTIQDLEARMAILRTIGKRAMFTMDVPVDAPTWTFTKPSNNTVFYAT